MKEISLSDAFKALDDLNEELFPLTAEGTAEMKDFLDGSAEDNVVKVVDPAAVTKDELKDSYVGKILCSCAICQSYIFKDESELHVDEDCPDVVNCGEECPVCQSVDGYKVIGRITPYEQEVEVKDTEEVNEDLWYQRLGGAGRDSDVFYTIAVRIRKGEDRGLKAVVVRKTPPYFSLRAGEVGKPGRLYFDSEKSAKAFIDKYLEPIVGDKEPYITVSVAGKRGVDLQEFSKLPGTYIQKRFAYLVESEDNGEVKPVNESKDSSSNIFDRVLYILDDEGYDVEDEGVRNFAESAAEYIQMTRDATDGRYSALQWYRDTKVNYPEELKALKRLDEAFVADDLARYQKWVDYDMKKYGKISDITNDKLTKAGLEVVKDDHGDYEVIAKEDNGEVIKESVDKVEVKADEQKVEVKQEGDKTVVEVSKECEACKDGEVVEPLDKSDKEEIETQITKNSNDVSIDEFDEEDFDELGEGYLKEVYENVASFKTTKGSIKDGRLVLEGVIKFNSGKESPTKFIFESVVTTKSGKVKFFGENLQLAGGKAFTLTGHADKGKLIAESLNYRYNVKNGDKGSTKLYGTIRKK